MRLLIRKADMRQLDMKAHICRTLWESSVDPATNFMSTDKLLLELKAGGVGLEHENEARRKLAAEKPIDFLDFLTYIPLFMMIHDSVIANPLDCSRVK